MRLSPELCGEIVAFTDASSMLASDSIRVLAQSFADPKIGAASGVYRLLKKDQAKLGTQEDLYWKYETFLKVQEAKLGAFTGAHGSLYAIRRELYPFPSAGTINDDFTIPMRILQRGYRVAYEPAAVAYEEAHEMEGFSRRVRIAAGNIEQLRELKSLVWPPRPFVLFCLLSHKTGGCSCRWRCSQHWRQTSLCAGTHRTRGCSLARRSSMHWLCFVLL